MRAIWWLPEMATTEIINFMVKARGLVCVPITAERAQCLDLELMAKDNTDRHGTAFLSVSMPGKEPHGISAAERAITARLLADPNTKSEDFLRPGHKFHWQRARVVLNGWTYRGCRRSYTACWSVSRRVICEIMNQDGSMARQFSFEVC